MLFDTLALISVLVIIIMMRTIINIFPSLMACVIRWKESVNLEASVKLKRDRDMFALAMMIPFCLTAVRFRLYDPAFLKGLGEMGYLGAVFGIFAAYVLLRTILNTILLSGKKRRSIDGIALRSAYSFFIIMTLLLLASGGILSFADVPETTIRTTMYWISGITYLLFLIRKTQIFISSGSFFVGILYLCALEFIPTGILVISAVTL